MSDNRLDKFTFEELQVMHNGCKGGFRGVSKLSIRDTQLHIDTFNKELDLEIAKRHKLLEAEIERTTPRCKCCNQRIEN